MKQLNISKKDIIFILVISLFVLMYDIMYVHNSGKVGYFGIVLAISEVLAYSTYIFLTKTPIIALIAYTISNLAAMSYTLLTTSSETYEQVIWDCLFLIVGTILAIVVHCKIIKNRLEKDENRLLNIINYERKPFNIKWYYKLILYSTFIIVIMKTADSDIIQGYLSGTMWNVYGSLAVILPYLSFISLLTTSKLSYELFGISILSKIFTVYLISAYNSNITLETIAIIIQLITFGYCLINMGVIKSVKTK